MGISEESMVAGEALTARLMTFPGASTERGVIYYLHGGGFYLGYPEMGYAMLEVMAQRTGMAVFALEYHKCPDISLPQIVDECVSGFRFIVSALKVSASKVFFIGDSAGAALVLLSLQKLSALGLSQPKGAIVLSPYLV